MKMAAVMAVAATLAACPIGCGKSDAGSAPERPRLALNGAEGPRAATIRYLRRVRNSVWPLALAQYDARVRRGFGLRRLAENLVFLRDTIARLETTILAGARRGRQGLVSVRVRARKPVNFPSKRRHFKFRLVLRRGRWLIVHDELTALSIQLQFEVFAQNEIDPGKPASPAARRSGRAVRGELDSIGRRAFERANGG